ncbi:hypothetical protein F0266_25895 [Vibrio coralliilyticus]|uniref:hypothetical protein n=1 Tax=Vibrio coralliilyticus TaxID=190893 RepID=UPI00148DF470|nr:hypothetical protein [Vibrio coralliilyticus]NOH56340.1 hypothetical protein [Vibrio coralliilyticus]
MLFYFRLTIMLSIIAVMGGCVASPVVEYKTPESSTAKLKVITSFEIAVNIPVYYHVGDKCSVDDAQLMGFIKQSNGPLYYADEPVIANIPVGEEVFISVPMVNMIDYDSYTMTSEYMQPIYSFVPNENVDYKLTFGPHGVWAYKSVNNDGKYDFKVNGKYYNSCKIIAKDVGSKGKRFYLLPN